MSKREIHLEQIREVSKNTLSEALGIEILSAAPDKLVGRMPVDHRTHQPAGMLHGGASVALAETLGSIGSLLHVTEPELIPVGIEINANHLRAVKTGFVTGTATPLRIGRSLHVWQIEIRDEEQNMVCVSRLTVQVTRRK